MRTRGLGQYREALAGLLRCQNVNGTELRLLQAPSARKKPTANRPSAFGSAPEVKCPTPMRLALALLLVVEDFVDANDLAIQRTRDQGVVINLAMLRVGNRHPIHVERATHGALVVGFRFDEIRQGPEFSALCVDQVALRQ